MQPQVRADPPARSRAAGRRRMSASTAFPAYVTAIVAAGTALLLLGLVTRVPAHLATIDVSFGLLAALLVAAEVRHITVHRRGGVNESISLSGAFACALLLHYDWSLVVLALALASVVDDCQSRSGWWKAAFNASQYTLSLIAAAGVLALLGGAPDVSSDRSLPVLVSLSTCAVFFLANTALPGVLIALLEGAPVVRSLRDDLPLQWSVNGVVVAMAPLVVAVANDSLWLVGLLVVPVLAVHRGAVSALEREHMTLHDPLTGLPNQIAFQQRLVEQLEAAGEGEHVAVLVLALDHMDDVSNTLGPSAAEALLEQVASRLRTTVPDGAVLARSSGGGFAVAVPGLRSPWEASACADAMLGQFSDPYDVVESAFALRASVGLTVSPLHGTDPEQLVQHAEVARGVALRSRSGLEVYSAERNDFTERRLAVLRGLGPALRRREMTVHFQPQVQVSTGQVTGYEALLRWDHPQLGRVAPDEFVALAEHAGMMHEVTDYVLDEALRRVAAWRRAGLAGDGLGERLGERAAGPRPAGAGRPAARAVGRAEHRAGPGAHRDRRHVPPAALPGGHARAAHPARRPLARRLRHRLRLAGVPHDDAGRRAQDRQVVRAGDDRQPRRPRRRPLDARAGPLARPAGGRRGRRGRSVRRAARQLGVPDRAGLALRPARAGPGRRARPDRDRAGRADPGSAVDGGRPARTPPDSPDRT